MFYDENVYDKPTTTTIYDHANNPRPIIVLMITCIATIIIDNVILGSNSIQQMEVKDIIGNIWMPWMLYVSSFPQVKLFLDGTVLTGNTLRWCAVKHPIYLSRHINAVQNTMPYDSNMI